MVCAGAIAATAGSLYLSGQGTMTSAFGAISSATLKAKARQQAIGNAYGYLLLATGVFVTIKHTLPETMVGNLMLQTLTLLFLGAMISMFNKDMKDRILTGKKPKNDALYEIPLSVRKFFCLPPARPFQEAQILSELASKENKDTHKETLVLKDKKIKLKFSIEGGKLTAKYTNIKPKEQKALGLMRIKVEKPSETLMAAFLLSSMALTLFSSWATKEKSLSLLRERHLPYKYAQEYKQLNPDHFDTSQFGQGVVTNMLSSNGVTFMKQTGKLMPVIPRTTLMAVVSISAYFLEKALLRKGKTPFLFAAFPIAMAVGMLQKAAKMYINGKDYGPQEYFFTPSFLERLTACFKRTPPPQEETEMKLITPDDVEQ